MVFGVNGLASHTAKPQCSIALLFRGQVKLVRGMVGT